MRPARQCRCQKASFAAPAGRPIPKVGNAAPTAVSTRCGPAWMDRSASSCSGSFRSSSSGRERRTSAAPAPAVHARPGPRRGRNNSSEAATADRNVRSAEADRSRNVLPGSARRSSSKERRRLRDSGPAGVADVAAAAGTEKNPLRIRVPPLRSNRGPRASRVLPARRRHRARLGKRGEHRAPRVTVRNDADVFAAGGAVAGEARKAGRRQRRPNFNPRHRRNRLTSHSEQAAFTPPEIGKQLKFVTAIRHDVCPPQRSNLHTTVRFGTTGDTYGTTVPSARLSCRDILCLRSHPHASSSFQHDAARCND